MNQFTLIAGDIQYLSFYLKEEDNMSGSITYADITLASSIVLRLRKYGESTNTVMGTCEILDGTLGKCRMLVTIPTITGDYQSEVEVFIGGERLTWKGNTYYIHNELG
jgi:hypothetical protein